MVSCYCVHGMTVVYTTQSKENLKASEKSYSKQDINWRVYNRCVNPYIKYDWPLNPAPGSGKEMSHSRKGLALPVACLGNIERRGRKGHIRFSSTIHLHLVI